MYTGCEILSNCSDMSESEGKEKEAVITISKVQLWVTVNSTIFLWLSFLCNSKTFELYDSRAHSLFTLPRRAGDEAEVE